FTAPSPSAFYPLSLHDALPISPLLSRSLVVVLQPLSEQALSAIVDAALSDREQGLGRMAVTMSAGAKQRLVSYGNGDARALLTRSEEHTSELQSRGHLVCRLLL